MRFKFLTAENTKVSQRTQRRNMTIYKRFTYRLQAGALLYAVCLSFLIILVSGMVVMSAFYYNRYADNAIQRDKLLVNLNSGIRMVISDKDIVKPGEKVTIDLYDEGIDKVDLFLKSWGVYSILTAQTQWKKYKCSRTVLMGEDMNRNDSTALYLSDKNNYLSLCGKTILNGLCYLPKLGLRRAYIEGQSYIGTKLVNGIVRNSEKQLPAINPDIIKNNELYLLGGKNDNDSLRYFEEIMLLDSVENSFGNKTLLVFSESAIVIDGRNFRGNMIIQSKRNITITKNNILRDIIIYAPGIIIEPGFTGILQVFATDSIVLGEECQLLYPSFAGIISKNTGLKQAFLVVGQKTKISGGLLLYNQNFKPNEHARISILRDAEIVGQVYSNDQAEHQGSIAGSLYCEKIVLNTPSSVYENHLLNAVIDRQILSRHFAGINLLSHSVNKKVIKWLD